MDRPQEDLDRLHRDLGRPADEVGAFNAHRLVRVHNNVWRLMWWQFLRGLAFGLGTVVGATALVSVVALILGQIEFIPIIGEIARAIIEEINGP
ncbi:DUF5665 domain-containing protein [Ponticoccus litoralis]|uniref:DUF5665 domain-containing protein n=1 Tax=Ponticoccus litoralis TaxID=422297 RepID=A0AAW9SPX8_9RHOB